MNYILLSGGSGSRLWPLSNEVRSKQFLKVLDKGDGTKESMVQRMYRMIFDVDKNANVIIATSKNQVSQIKTALNDSVKISIEPCRKDTFPAIALASLLLKKDGHGNDTPVIVCPVDSNVDEGFFINLSKMCAEVNNANLVLVGIKPKYPSEKYGYILPSGKFTEKPTLEVAKKLIDNGALWNGGVFAFKLSYIIDKIKSITGYSNYDDFINNYNKLEKISFDYAISEKESSIKVIEFDGKWEDLGSWKTLTDAMKDCISGEAILSDSVDSHLVNELSIPLIGIGLKNIIVAATPDGILVADKDKSSKVKDLIVNSRPMYEKREWGEYKVLDYKLHNDNNNSLTKELIIFPGKHISYQKHSHRTEMWTFIEGDGKLIINDKLIDVKRGDAITIVPEMKHAVFAITELHIIEVQLGDELIEEDIERFDYNWDSL